MPRRTRFKLSGFEAWVDNIKNTVSQEAAARIVDDLKKSGPYWSGDFESAWVVKAGDQQVSANRQPSEDRPPAPLPRQVTPTPVPKPTGRKSIDYTIGNEMVYRNVALDIEQGRIKKGGNETAPQDWYRTYTEGGKLRQGLREVTKRVIKGQE